jgi:hypothetical protein
MAEDQKPRRLYFKTYIQMVRNSVGSAMFKNWYVYSPERGEFDAMKDGEDSCAFYVSGLLKIFNKVTSIHGLVSSVAKDLEESGWQKVNKPKEGDVLIWEPLEYNGRMQNHIGFYIGNGKAVSTSWIKKNVVEHEQNFGGQQRKIEQIFRMESWDENNP